MVMAAAEVRERDALVAATPRVSAALLLRLCGAALMLGGVLAVRPSQPVRRLAGALSATLLLLAATIAPAAAQTTPTEPASDPVSIVRQVFAAFNTGNAAAQLAFFTDDAIFIGGPCNRAPGGTCVGKAQLQRALTPDPTRVATQVTLSPAPTLIGEVGNVVQVRTEARFPLPPPLTAAGVQRYVEVGQIVVNNGKIARIGLVADVTDQQTMTVLRFFATLGPPPGAAPATVARDGQSLASQPAAVQQQFTAVFGAAAAVEWVRQHDAALAAAGR